MLCIFNDYIIVIVENLFSLNDSILQFWSNCYQCHKPLATDIARLELQSASEPSVADMTKVNIFCDISQAVERQYTVSSMASLPNLMCCWLQFMDKA